MNKLRKIIFLLLLTICLVGIFTVVSQARIITDDPTVKSGGTVTINVSSQEEVLGYKVSIKENTGLTFLSATGGSYVEGDVVVYAALSPTKNVATYKFKAPEVTKDTTYTVTFSAEGVVISGNDDEETSSQATATVTVEAPPKVDDKDDDKNEQKPSNNEEKDEKPAAEPKFTKTNKKVYAKKEINLRSSWSTSSQATTIEGGTELTLTGTSTERIDGYIWYRVTYKGETKYVASTLITTEKPEEEEEEKSDNNSLKSLKVTPSGLTPNFDSETENYELTVGSNIDDVEVKATAADDKAKVKISGNKDLEIGENTIRIVVTAEDGTERVYKIVVTKEDEKQLGLKELLIENVSLSPKFEENVYSYTVEIEDTEIKELNITATATRKEAEVEIVGNTDLKVGDNIITIMVKADDGEIVTYQIKVTIKDPAAETNASVVEENNGSNDLKKYVVIAAAVLIIIAIVVIIISKNEEAEEETELEQLADEDLPKSLRKNKKEESVDKELELPVEKDLKDKIDELMSEETDNEEKRTTRKGKRFK